jgi:origin recognition complex subunit 6
MASVSQALDSLLPSRTHPPKLTSLANSLLAQSRLRAPNLKAEEEIARPYACAEIACSRLRVQLRLPASLKGRPPCKPGVYKKLIGFLKDVLIEQKDVPEQTISTPKKRMANGAVKGTTSTATTPASTPKRKDDFVGKVRAGERGQKEGEAPEWVMPLIRKLCKAFSTPLIPPHVYTGVCVVLKLAEIWPYGSSRQGSSEFTGNTSALIIAIYLLVLARMQNGDMSTDAYTRRYGRAIEIAELGEKAKGKEMVEGWIKKLDREGWCTEQDWWRNVPEGVIESRDSVDGIHGQGGADEEGNLVLNMKLKRRKGQDVLEEEEDDPEGVLLPGLGTMMQDAVHWLSEERKLEYRTWKEGLLRKIKLIERDASSGYS